MPDPAIDAYNLGIPYTEPTASSFFGKNKGKSSNVTLMSNPLDPSLPPKRLIEVDGKKGSWWNRKFGGKAAVWDEKPPPNMITPSPSRHSQAQGLSINPYTSLSTPPTNPSNVYTTPLPTGQDTHAYGSGQHLYTDLLPDQFWSLPWKERRKIEKMRAEQNKAVKDLEKARRDWEKVLGMEAERRYKGEVKVKKKELKAQEKLLRQQRKNPKRSLPSPHPSQGLPNLASSTTAQLSSSPNPNVKFMMMPTNEQFGVRRPMDHVGSAPWSPSASEWPMMSRTLTHAMVDMSREERVHAVSAGTVWGGGWGGHW